MRIYRIRSHRDDSILYEGTFSSITHCLEAGVLAGASLAWADLAYQNLANANLDDALLSNACFIGSNLTGANLSEAQLSGAQFQEADLFNTCMAFADLSHARFEGANFGATDIAGADLSHCRFSGMSCYSLDFTAARRMDNCRFVNPQGIASVTSTPPIVIRGLPQGPLILMDDSVNLGQSGATSNGTAWVGLLRAGRA